MVTGQKVACPLMSAALPGTLIFGIIIKRED